MRPTLRGAESYDPSTVETVERLLELLSELAREPYLDPRLVLHGGTALNLFHGPVPRLSVDADLLYVGSSDRETMLAERPEVESSLCRVARSLGYQVGQVAPQRDTHAGCTLRLVGKADA